LVELKAKYSGQTNSEKLECSDEPIPAELEQAFRQSDEILRSNGIKPSKRPFEGFREAGITRCSTRIDIGGRLVFNFVDGKLAAMRVVFSGSQFSDLAEGLKKKWGEPTKTEVREYQNGFGAKREGLILWWNNGVSRIELRQYDGILDASKLEITDSVLYPEFQRREPKDIPEV